MDGQRASGFDSNSFLIPNISQSYHLSIVKCEVTNDIGKSEETETIQVRYGPHIIASPTSTSGDVGDSVSLHCQVDSNPAPTYTWTKGTSRQVSYTLVPRVILLQAVGSSQNLTVIVSQRTEGQVLPSFGCFTINTLTKFKFILPPDNELWLLPIKCKKNQGLKLKFG